MSAKNEIRKALRTELMSFSKSVRNIDEVIPFVKNYAIARTLKGKRNNDIIMSFFEDDGFDLYNFLNHCRLNVVVFGGILDDKKTFTQDKMYNLLCAIIELPKQDFKGKVRPTKEGQTSWDTVKMIGFTNLLKGFEAYKGDMIVNTGELVNA